MIKAMLTIVEIDGPGIDPYVHIREQPSLQV